MRVFFFFCVWGRMSAQVLLKELGPNRWPPSCRVASFYFFFFFFSSSLGSSEANNDAGVLPVGQYLRPSLVYLQGVGCRHVWPSLMPDSP
jgi:hypothetical protein